jgi:hypothetical protein
VNLDFMDADDLPAGFDQLAGMRPLGGPRPGSTLVQSYLDAIARCAVARRLLHKGASNEQAALLLLLARGPRTEKQLTDELGVHPKTVVRSPKNGIAKYLERWTPEGGEPTVALSPRGERKVRQGWVCQSPTHTA